MEPMALQGCYTALVTPFRNGAVDYGALRDLVEEQIAAGIDGLVPVGTTGESPTLDFDEHDRVIQAVVDTANHRCVVIAGTGANATDEAIRLTQHAASAGADATLQVTPYYNRPTQEGLYRHFSKVADEGGLPVVLYNVPSRTGREIELPTIQKLAQNPRIVAIKEAGGSVDRVSMILSSSRIDVLSGDDSLTLPMVAVGAKGVISVASNVCPVLVVRMVRAALSGDWGAARELHYRLYPLFRDLFVESNPVPVKAALAMMGKIAEEYRLPLCPIGDGSRKILTASMRAAGLGAL